MSQQPPWNATGQQSPGYPPPGPQHGQPPRKSWPARHKALTIILGVVGLFVVIGAAGAAAGGGTSTKTVTQPGPTVTVTETNPGPTVTATATVQATQNAQGKATQISDDGVYVVGQDIPAGTWHTSGGGQCYEATLSGTDTIHDIISNNNFQGPSTVSLSGAKAFEINGGCTWNRE
jgi:hypothetical protein